MAIIDDESKWMDGKEYGPEDHACIKCGIAPCDCGGYTEFSNDPCCWGCSICAELEGDENDSDDNQGGS